MTFRNYDKMVLGYEYFRYGATNGRAGQGRFFLHHFGFETGIPAVITPQQAIREGAYPLRAFPTRKWV